ncbi:MAG: MarR family winged helix-turn-helix transcriptional regulator [Pseudomonadota bacterium]
MSSTDQSGETHKETNGPDTPDAIDQIQQEWTRIRPDLPLRSIGVITRIWRIAKLLSEDRRRTMNELGVEPAIRDLLANLRRSGDPYRLRTSELATRCRVSKSAITQRVARAEAAGLVRSTRSVSGEEANGALSAESKDQRAVWIELTPQGRDLVDSTVEKLLEHEESLVEGLGEKDIAQLSTILRRLLRLLEQR